MLNIKNKTETKIEENKKSIIKKLCATAALVTVGLSAVGTIVIQNSTSSEILGVKATEMKYANNIISTVVNGFIAEYTGIAQTLANNGTVISFLERTGMDSPMGVHEDYKLALAQIKNVKNLRQGIICNVAIGNVEEDVLMNSQGVVQTRDKFSLKARPYYHAITDKVTVVTEPYISASDGKLNVTIATPVYHSGGSGNVVGIAVVDITMESIQKMIEDFIFGETGESVIVSEKGDIIAHKDSEKIGENISVIGISDEDVERILEGNGGLFGIDINGKEHKTVSNKFDGLGWSIVTTINDKEFDSETNRITNVVIVIQSIITGALILCLTRKIKETLLPINDITKVMENLSRGELTQTLDSVPDDEIGRLYDITKNTTNKLSLYINDIGMILKSISEGDFTQRTSIEFEGEFKQIEKDLYATQNILKNTINQINISSENVMDGARQMAERSEDLAHGATEQSYILSCLAEDVSRISQESMNSSSELMRTSENAVSAKESVIKNQEAMSNLSHAMKEIEKISTEINGVIKVIDDIAEETNLLSLNASIEAARAGEQGRGFAIVANEIGKLANKSMEAVNDTRRLIESVSDVVSNGLNATNEVATELNVVVEKTNQVTEQIDKIAKVSMEQSYGIQGINQQIEKISSVVERNAQIADENSSMSQEFYGSAEEMKNIVSRFKL